MFGYKNEPPTLISNSLVTWPARFRETHAYSPASEALTAAMKMAERFSRARDFPSLDHSISKAADSLLLVVVKPQSRWSGVPTVTFRRLVLLSPTIAEPLPFPLVDLSSKTGGSKNDNVLGKCENKNIISIQLRLNL